MKTEKFDAVEIKRYLQKKAEEKLSKLSEKEQLKFLSERFNYLRKRKKMTMTCVA